MRTHLSFIFYILYCIWALQQLKILSSLVIYLSINSSMVSLPNSYVKSEMSSPKHNFPAHTLCSTVRLLLSPWCRVLFHQERFLLCSSIWGKPKMLLTCWALPFCKDEVEEAEGDFIWYCKSSELDLNALYVLNDGTQSFLISSMYSTSPWLNFFTSCSSGFLWSS